MADEQSGLATKKRADLNTPPPGATPREKRDSLDALLRKPSMERLFATVAGKAFKFERLTKLMSMACTREPKLLECTQMSIVVALLKATELDLDIGQTQEAHVIPFKNKHTQRMEAVLITGYRGLLKIARRSGEIQDVQARVVWPGELFECEFGLEPKLRHVPGLDEHQPNEKPILAYAVVRLKDGGAAYDVMTAGEIERIRQAAPGRNADAWVNHWNEMAKKTVLRRTLKLAPLSSAAAEVVSREEELMSGGAARLEPLSLPAAAPAALASGDDDVADDLSAAAVEETDLGEDVVEVVPEEPALKPGKGTAGLRDVLRQKPAAPREPGQEG